MTKEQLYALLAAGKIDRVKDIFQLKYDIKIIEEAIKQYDPRLHDVHDLTKLEDRKTYKESAIEDETGNKKMVLDCIKPVPRIAAPFQDQIVLLRSSFIGDPKITSKPEKQEGKDLIALITKIWHDNKMSYKFSETKKRTMSELRCAWLVYATEDETYWEGQPIKPNAVKPRVKLLSHQLGDALYPLYDLNDDLIAFAREYEVSTFNDELNEVKEIHLDIYTDDRIYYKKKVNGVWQDAFTDGETALQIDPIGEGLGATYKKNIVGKIPVIYFAQEKPEWYNVQDACNRMDQLFSKHAYTNDYFGDPILFGKAPGGTLSLPQKEDSGKYIEGNDKDTDLKFVTWDNAPESVKMEIENLYEVIFSLSNTVRFKDFETLGQMSGFATILRFLLPILKAKDCEMSIFGEGVQRCYNYFKKMISVLDGKYKSTLSLPITAEFASVLPTDVSEVISNINKAKTGGMLSDETAIEQNPLVKDPEVEKARIKAEGDVKHTKELDKQKQLSELQTKTLIPVNN